LCERSAPFYARPVSLNNKAKEVQTWKGKGFGRPRDKGEREVRTGKCTRKEDELKLVPGALQPGEDDPSSKKRSRVRQRKRNSILGL